jgi:hypothetical protein
LAVAGLGTRHAGRGAWGGRREESADQVMAVVVVRQMSGFAMVDLYRVQPNFARLSMTRRARDKKTASEHLLWKTPDRLEAAPATAPTRTYGKRGEFARLPGNGIHGLSL